MRKGRAQAQYTSMVAKTEHQKAVIDGVALWAAYYRSNPHRFVEDYLHVSLKLFQIFVLFMMNVSTTFVMVACRGIGKSFMCAVYCCTKAILYPGVKICIASGTRGQAINVLEKIMTELKPNSPELANEIDDTETSMNNTTAKIAFKNGSYIKVVTATDNSRGNRANILVIDEFRMVKKDIIDTVLKKFIAAPRHPKYLDIPEYKKNPELQEHNCTMYLSSAYYADHWSYAKCKDVCKLMIDETKRGYICGFPYQLALDEDLLQRETVEEQMLESDFNEITWSINISVLFKSTERYQAVCYRPYGIRRKCRNAIVLTGEL